jgi:fatty-acyl-CoA synthase
MRRASARPIALAGHSAPARTAGQDLLPRTATGKVQKFVLREREWQGRERRVN